MDKQQRVNHSSGKTRRQSDDGKNGPAAAEIDQARIQAAVREILLAVGEDPNREGLRETPDRVARMYAEMFAGLHKDPREPLQKTFTQKYDEMVVVKDIGFEGMCEHHLLPFIGKAHIAYLPNGKIVGLSKLARVVEVLARRPQVQERMTEELADLLMHELDARGVGVILEASHTCMTIRGIRKPNSICTTSAMRGGFKTYQSTRAELMALVYGDGDAMLAIFCLRLACGLAATLLLLSPAQVNPRFYRVQFLTILGLNAVAAVSLRQAADVNLWLTLGAALVLAFLGSLIWSLEGAPAGRLLIVLDVVVQAAALGWTRATESSGREVPWLLLDDFSSAVLLGSALTAMLMGHSYLIAPAMSLTPLLRLLGALFACTLLRLLVAAVGLWSWTTGHSLVNLNDETVLWLPLRWGLGFVGPLILTWMAWQAARIRSTQSATGILYVVVIFCFLGELTSQLLSRTGFTL